MAIDIYENKFRYWLKGIFGLNATRSALCEYITGKLKDYVKYIPESQLKQFFSCLKANQIFWLKTQSRNTNEWKCGHQQCEALMQGFIDIHTVKHSLKYSWTLASSNRNDTSNLSNEDVLWNVIMLFMHIERHELSETTYSSLEDLDISHIIKVMRCCKLSSPDGSAEAYEKVLVSRNKLMHSPENKMKEDETKGILFLAKQLLDCLDISEEAYYKGTIQHLQDLAEEDFVIRYQSEDYKTVIDEVREAEGMADKLYQNIEDENQVCKKQSRQLHEKLKQIGCLRCSKLEMQSSEYKSKVKDALLEKLDAIVKDMAEYDEKSERFKELEILKQKTEQEVKTLQEIIEKPELESMYEMTDRLNKEVAKLKEEQKQTKLEKRRLEEEVEKQSEMLEALEKNVTFQEPFKREKEREETTIDYETFEGQGRAYRGKKLFFCYDDGIYSMTYMSKFTINNVEFWCVLQYTMYKETEFCYPETAEEILECNSKKLLLEIDERIKEYKRNESADSRFTFAYEGNDAKFQQNQLLNSKLLSTKCMDIVFSSEHDQIWGIGLPIGHPDSFNKLKWKGRNELGIILTQIRHYFNISLF